MKLPQNQKLAKKAVKTSDSIGPTMMMFGGPMMFFGVIHVFFALVGAAIMVVGFGLAWLSMFYGQDRKNIREEVNRRC